MMLRPLERADEDAVLGWLARKENHQWLDFGDGSQPVSPLALKIMLQKRSKLCRVFTADSGEAPIEPIPIGRPCPGEELEVLDEMLAPVPAGEVGELYIRGVGLSPGYWRDSERTAAAFLSNPRSSDPRDRIYRTGDLAREGEGGLIYYLGRADSQIKSRGYRIELGEIESALSAMSALVEVAVVGTASDGFEGTAICCAYVAPPASPLTPATLRSRLGRELPAYMLPSRWMSLERLPRNANGKIDRRRLKEMFEREAERAR